MSYPIDLDECSDEHLMEEVQRRRNLLGRGLCTYCERSSKTKPCKFPERHAEALPLGLKREEAFNLLSWTKKVDALATLVHKLVLTSEDVRNDHFELLGKRFDKDAMESRELNDGLTAALNEARQTLVILWRGKELPPKKRKTGDMPAAKLAALKEESRKR